MLTDTTFWVDLAQERANGAAGAAHEFLGRHRAQTLEVSIVTWGELAAGVRRPEELDRLLRRVRVLMLHRGNPMVLDSRVPLAVNPPDMGECEPNESRFAFQCGCSPLSLVDEWPLRGVRSWQSLENRSRVALVNGVKRCQSLVMSAFSS